MKKKVDFKSLIKKNEESQLKKEKPSVSKKEEAIIKGYAKGRRPWKD